VTDPYGVCGRQRVNHIRASLISSRHAVLPWEVTAAMPLRHRRYAGDICVVPATRWGSVRQEGMFRRRCSAVEGWRFCRRRRCGLRSVSWRPAAATCWPRRVGLLLLSWFF